MHIINQQLSFLKPIFQQLKTDFMLPQESNTAEEAQEMTEDTKNLLEEFISGILKVANRLIGVNVSNLHILDITLEVTSENTTEVIIPIIAEVNVKPYIGLLNRVVDLQSVS
ncbi:short palate, lung and nasal epithelium carcinoma-associated protein 2A-like [Ovis aries]|uniref:short palate, lung and nasal epithelium carcinoma-associated protein 2A-like n=1 Tax=Ovis aries TaxID=9940 RepID=UPI00295273CD|nr:short palate, lung and nasal epithelium carcinoma-associated protein 2A-like [Ovis aries]